jgi:cysteine desulfurase
LGVDSLALSGHKAGAAKGIGALVVRAGLDLVAQSLGGGQERRRRAGTENTLGIASLGAVAGEIDTLLKEAPKMAALRDRLEKELAARVPAARILAQKAQRLPNTTCVAFAGVSSETQVIALDLAQVAVSAGSACSSGKIAASHVLTAMGVEPGLAAGAIRVSLGWESTAEDVDRFIAAYAAMAAKHAAPLAAARSA